MERSERATERAGAVATAGGAEEQLRLLIECATDYAIVTLDGHRRVTSWNPGAARMFGYDEGEVVGRPFDLLFTPEDRAAGVPEQETRTARQKGRASDERWHVRKDGTRFYAVGMVIRLSDGEFRGFAKIARDLTERKRAEDAVLAARDRLEAEVAERTAELSRTVERLRAEVRAREQVEAARNDLLRRLATALEDERSRFARELIDQTAQQMTGLALAMKAAIAPLPPATAAGLAEVQRLASELIARMHALAGRLRPTALDDIGLPAAAEQLALEWAARSGVRVDCQTVGLGEGRLAAEVETVLYRVVEEALSNAARHARAGRVSVIVGVHDRHAVAVIEDDGTGFDPRGDGRNRLGLAGLRERVGLAGGELEIESEAGRGTTVIARVPVVHRIARRDAPG